MVDDNLTDKERILKLEVMFGQHINRVDSYHHDGQQKMEKIFEKLDNIPSEDKIFRMFAEQGEKLAKGLIKQIDEAKVDIKELKGDVEKAQKEAEKANSEIKFAKRQGYIFASIATSFCLFISWLIDAKDKIASFFKWGSSV